MKRHFCNKYKNNEIESINLPIFDHEASKSQLTKRVHGDAYTILYSGGSQKWQNTDLMIESTSKLIHRFNFVFLTGDTNVFQSKLDEYSLNNNVELKSVEKNKVYEEYKKADFGFVLRDENTVNTVSCPTKLIEYLTYGLIPIVIQPEIGDFNDLGYKYILLEDLLEKELPSYQELEAMRLWNWSIIQNMSTEVSESKKKLKQLAFCKES
jgi:glycosyltransferase involved in cell wall biosynthesis